MFMYVMYVHVYMYSYTSIQSSFSQRDKYSLKIARTTQTFRLCLHMYNEHLVCISEYSNITNSGAITRGITRIFTRMQSVSLLGKSNT